MLKNRFKIHKNIYSIFDSNRVGFKHIVFGFLKWDLFAMSHTKSKLIVTEISSMNEAKRLRLGNSTRVELNVINEKKLH